MIVVRWFLALLTVAYALFNAIAPFSTALYKLQTEWPEGWAQAQKALSFPSFSMGGAGTSRFADLMDATNWLQVAMWLLADLLYLIAALRLMGRRSPGAASVFAVAWLLDAATWLTFKQMPVYNATFSQDDQLQTQILYAVLAGLGAVIWLAGRRKRRPRRQPVMLME
jgi:hypothetical protein